MAELGFISGQSEPRVWFFLYILVLEETLKISHVFMYHIVAKKVLIKEFVGPFGILI